MWASRPVAVEYLSGILLILEISFLSYPFSSHLVTGKRLSRLAHVGFFENSTGWVSDNIIVYFCCVRSKREGLLKWRL